MALRHEAEFKNDRHETYYLAFYDSEYSGADPISDLVISSAGFELEWDGKAESFFQPIISSGCTIPIISNDSDSEDFVDAIMGGQEGQFRVEIWQGPEVSRKLFWSGVLICDLTIRDEMPSSIRLSATDDLGLLSEIPYKQTASAAYTDSTHLIDVLCRILSKCRHLDAWGSAQNFLFVADHVQHADMTGAPYTRKIIINHQKLQNPDGSGQPQYHSCRDVLINMMQNLSARIFQADGFFWVMPLGKQATSGTSFWAYYKDGSNGNLTDKPVYAGAYTGSGNQFAVSYRVLSTGFTKLAGFEFGQLPPLASVSYAHKYNGSAFDWYGLGPSNGTDISDGWSFANGSPQLESGDIVSLTFAYHFSFQGWGSSGGPRGRRLKFSFKYRHGSTIYAVRTADPMTDSSSDIVTQIYSTAGNNVESFVPEYGSPGYSAATGNRVECFTGVFDRYVGADLQGSFTITFPALSSDANDITELGFWEMDVLNADGSVDTTAPSSFAIEGLSDIYQMRGAATFDGDVINYERINDDTNTRESIDLKPAILADKVGNSNPNQSVWLINANGTYQRATGDWSNSIHSTISTTISDLACLDIISTRFDPVDTCSGDIEGPYYLSPLFALQNIGQTAGYYVPLRLSMRSGLGQFAGEWGLLAFSTDDNSSSTNDGTTPFAISGMSTAGPRSARQTLQGIAQAIAFDQERILQETQSINQTAADAVILTDGKLAALALDDLSDVSVPSPTTGYFLKWDGSAWRPAAVSGGGASALDDLSDVDVGSAADGQLLKYNAGNSEWEAADQDVPAFADLTDVNPNLSPAGGDLLIWTTANGGQWSSTTPQLAIGSAIDAGDLGNVTEGSGSSGNILVDFNLGGAYWITQTPAQWAGTHLALGLLSNVSSATPSTGDLLQWTGSQWAPYTPPAAFSYATLQSSFYTGDGNGDYIPFGGTLTETTSSQYYNRYTAPLAGEIVEARIFCTTSSAGSCALRFSKYPVPQTIATATATISSANTAVQFDFSGNATFSAGDQLRLWFDPTGTPGGVSVSILLKFTH